MNRKPTSELLNKYVIVRFPGQDYQGFHKLADFLKASLGRLMRHLLRENILGQSDPLPDHLKSFREAVYQFTAAGRNLNQLVRAGNSVDPIDQRQFRVVCEELKTGSLLRSKKKKRPSSLKSPNSGKPPGSRTIS
jgi:hypothetical protein